MARDDRGFTLVEILVVMAIISILAGLSAYGILSARRSGEETAARVELQMLCSRIDSFHNAFGRYPPTTLAGIPVKGNGINDGNESLFLFLTSRKRGGPFADDLEEDRWQNADGDTLTEAEAEAVAREISPTRGTAALLEYVDLFGSPFVYIHSRDYGKKLKYQAPAGSVFVVEAQKSPKTGTYFSPTTYQLWSLGRDGVNQNGGGDDLASWE